MLQGEVVKEYLERFPNTATRALSRLIYRDNKELFRDVEATRRIIRYYRGSAGKDSYKNKEKYGMKKKFKTFPELPKSLTTLDWNVNKITGDHKIFLINDLHIPFHDYKAVKLSVSYARKEKPDIILLNGDIFDFYSLSRWEKDPRLRDFLAEINAVDDFLGWLRGNFPKARIIFKEGNHEERFESYLRINAPELIGLEITKLSNLLSLDNYGIEWIGEKQPIKINELFILHGHEYRFAISNPVNPARGLYLRSKVNALCGHFHQSSSHSETDLNGKNITTYSVGCLSELHPRYMPLNKWNLGFAIIVTMGEKHFWVRNYKIINGEIYNT